jgi:hypothetical protein
MRRTFALEPAPGAVQQSLNRLWCLLASWAPLVLSLMLLPPAAYSGTVLPDRTTLDNLLGSAAIGEDFQAFDLQGQPVLDVGTVLDSSTGAIVDGVSFSAFGNALVIRDLGFLGLTQVLDADGSGPRTLLIDFSVPVSAFGFDFISSVLVGTDVSVTVFASDDSSVLEHDAFTLFFLKGFIGVSEPAGIGSVTISATARAPLDFVKDVTIDDLTFGSASTAIPEPPTSFLVFAALASFGALHRHRHRSK